MNSASYLLLVLMLVGLVLMSGMVVMMSGTPLGVVLVPVGAAITAMGMVMLMLISVGMIVVMVVRMGMLLTIMLVGMVMVVLMLVAVGMAVRVFSLAHNRSPLQLGCCRRSSCKSPYARWPPNARTEPAHRTTCARPFLLPQPCRNATENFPCQAQAMPLLLFFSGRPDNNIARVFVCSMMVPLATNLHGESNDHQHLSLLGKALARGADSLANATASPR